MSLSALRSPERSVAPTRSLQGSLRAPGDKSISHRAVLFNALGEGSARITNFSPGGDCASSLACLRNLGVEFERDGDQVRLQGAGCNGLREPADVLDCGNSGTTMRLLSGILAGAGVFAVLTGDDSLRSRPMARIVDPLRKAGASIDGRDGGRLPPLVISPAARLRAIEHRLSVASAQVKSALLLAGLFAEGETTVIEPAPTRDHTERLLRAMGADVRGAPPRTEANTTTPHPPPSSMNGEASRRPSREASQPATSAANQEGNVISIRPPASLRCVDVEVPGDFSSAAFWLVLGVLHPRAEIRVANVGLNPTRTGLLTILRSMGANVEVENQRDVAGEPVADLVVRSSQLRGTTVGGDLVPLAIDEIPLVALLGLFADGETVVTHAAELRAKESDRLAVVANGLAALGGDVEATNDGWRIRPSHLHAGRVDSHGDHRMAMLFALAGTLGEGVEIAGADSVSISYPSFWADLGSLGSQS